MLALADDEGAEQLARLEHRQRPAYPALVVGARRRGRRVEHRLALGGPGWPGRRELQPATDDQPDLGPLGTGAVGEDPGHPRRQLLGVVAAGHGLRERPQHVVRRGPALVDRAGGSPLEPRLHRVEGQRHDRGRDDGEGDVRRGGVPEQGTHAEHQHDVHQDDEGDQAREHQGVCQQLATRSPTQPPQPCHECSVRPGTPLREVPAPTTGVGVAARSPARTARPASVGLRPARWLRGPRSRSVGREPPDRWPPTPPGVTR